MNVFPPNRLQRPPAPGAGWRETEGQDELFGRLGVGVPSVPIGELERLRARLEEPGHP